MRVRDRFVKWILERQLKRRSNSKSAMQGKSISIVVWESANDSGYQIVGKVDRVSESAMLNGYAPEVEGIRVYPQVKQRLFVKVEQVLLFSIAPHGDIEA